MDVIELLNEPAGWVGAIGDAISGYWQDGYKLVRQYAGNGPQVMIEDAFLGIDVNCHMIIRRDRLLTYCQNWQNFMKYPQATGVIMDEVSS